MYMRRVLAAGLALWMIGTVLLRLAGHRYLPARAGSKWLLLYAISVLAVVVVSRGIYRWAGIPRREWLAAAALFILPTLMLDAFTTLFFARIFPELNPAVSGAFGGWMLICSAGAVAGAMVHR